MALQRVGTWRTRPTRRGTRAGARLRDNDSGTESAEVWSDANSGGDIPPVARVDPADAPGAEDQLLAYAQSQVMFAQRHALTAHSLHVRLASWCRQQGWRCERRIVDSCARAVTLAMLEGHPCEGEFAQSLTSPAVQRRIDAMNRCASGVVDGPARRWWREHGERVIDVATVAVGASALAVPMVVSMPVTMAIGGVGVVTGVLSGSWLLRRLSRGTWSMPSR